MQGNKWKRAARKAHTLLSIYSKSNALQHSALVMDLIYGHGLHKPSGILTFLLNQSDPLK